MESPESDDARAALADAEASRDRLVTTLKLPRFVHATAGVGLALVVCGLALGVRTESPWGTAIIVGTCVVPLALGLLQTWRFRRLNGTSIDRIGRLVLSAGRGSSFIFAVTFFATQVASDRDRWLLFGLAATGGGVVQAWASRRWWRRYQTNPAWGTQPDPFWSPGVLVAFSVIVIGLLLLVFWP